MQRRLLRRLPWLSDLTFEPAPRLKRAQPRQRYICRSLLDTGVQGTCVNINIQSHTGREVKKASRVPRTPSITHSEPAYSAPTVPKPFPPRHMPLPMSLNICAVFCEVFIVACCHVLERGSSYAKVVDIREKKAPIPKPMSSEIVTRMCNKKICEAQCMREIEAPVSRNSKEGTCRVIVYGTTHQGHQTLHSSLHNSPLPCSCNFPSSAAEP